jgi:glycerol-3-phosphate acyltransferase PlsY
VLGAALVVVVGYALGCVPTALLVGRRTGHDPSTEGSGNPGASNTFRVAGRRAGALVLAGDLLKGALAAGLGLLVGGRGLGFAAGAAAVAGHIVPITRPRRGGKGVATAAGVALVLEPLVSLLMAVLWIVVARTTRLASLASLVVAVAFPVAVAIAGRPGWEVAGWVVLAAVVMLRHGGNVRRLLRGREARLSSGP